MITSSSAVGSMLVRDPTVEPEMLSPAAMPAVGAGIRSVRTIDAARQGDRAALSVLLRELQDPWYRLCLSLLRDPDLAADAVQETGLRFLKQVAGFRGDSQLRTWSLGIAINVVRETKRRRARQLNGLAGETGALGNVICHAAPPPVQASELGESCDALHRMLADLPDRQREAVLLRFFEDLSVEETARLMGCAAGTVKATVHQALRSLRKRLKQWG